MKKTLKEWRKEAKLTQEQAATKLRVSHDTISRWESGVTQPTALQIDSKDNPWIPWIHRLSC